MPNTYNFFSKGVICTNAYSDSEWTTPSFSSYWTGRYSDKTMNLNTDIWFPFNQNTKLLAEYFEEKDILRHVSTATTPAHLQKDICAA